MKLPKEQVFIAIVGLFLLSYLLENIVTPLQTQLATPYSFLNPTVFSKYPFTAVVVIIRAISLFITPLFFLSFIDKKYFVKAVSLLIVGSLAQLYSLQQLISGTTMIPLEWAISLSIAGALLIIPLIIFCLQGLFHFTKAKIKANPITFEDIDLEE
jgi:hypothetical protein